MSASLVFREPRSTAPTSCFVSGTRGSFRNALQILIVCPTSRLPRKISTLPKYRAFWLLTGDRVCVSTMTDEVGGNR